MRHSGDYYRACNSLVTALEELKVWTESMHDAIARLDAVSGKEKYNLEQYIRDEIEHLDEKFSGLKKEFAKKLNGRGKKLK